MARFVIAGKPDCPAFVHGVHVISYLQERLPNFKAEVIQKKNGDWESWLKDTNKKNRWYHTRSPIIWKELSMRGGIPHYVGGLSQFWEYCYDYYGLESIIDPKDLPYLVADNLQYFEFSQKVKKEIDKNYRIISIIGLSDPIISLLLFELNQIPNLQKPSGLVINLYDPSMELSEMVEFVDDITNDIGHLTNNGSRKIFELVDTMKDLLSDCELLIILGDYSREQDETETNWLIRNTSTMYMLADNINLFAKNYIKIILAMNGPICYNANVLIESCTSIRIQKIVAVTNHIALGPLQKLAEQANVPLSNLSAPPVWGFIGLNEFIDIESTIIRCDVYRPYQRILTNKGGSTLPLGVIQPNLYFISYLIDNVDEILAKATARRDLIRDKLKRSPNFAKVRSIISLLKLWYANESSDAIISLGVCSNGIHEIYSYTTGAPSGEW